MVPVADEISGVNHERSVKRIRAGRITQMSIGDVQEG